MRMRIAIWTAATTMFMALTACAPDQGGESASEGPGPLGPGVVATINDTPLPESLFRFYVLNGLQKPAEDLTDEERAGVIEDLVRVRLLADAAAERGLPDERTIAVELELQRLQLLARAAATRFLDENPPGEAELRALYEENLSRLMTNQYKARHILLATEDEAVSVIAALDEGGDFAELAMERSTGPTGPGGGDLGWFSAESMVEPFADAVRAMEDGSYSSEPVRTQFGWHVIMLEETREQQPPGLDAVRDELTRAVEQQKLEAYVQSLEDAAVIELR